MIELTTNKNNIIKKRITIVLLRALIVILYTIIRPILTNPETYKNSYTYLNEKLSNAKMLTLGSSSASLIVSLLPEDAGTPIANELAELSGYLLIVVSVIFMEQYLMTTVGFVASSIILPIACLFGIIATLIESESKTKLKEYATRLAIFGICITLVIPIGCFCGQNIEAMNSLSIETALNDAKQANEIIKSIPNETQNKNIFERVGDFFASLWNNASEAYEWSKSVLSDFLSSIAVMLITTIAIPLLVFFCFLWLIRFITKRDFVKLILGFQNKHLN